jgi:UrcA family protein
MKSATLLDCASWLKVRPTITALLALSVLAFAAVASARDTAPVTRSAKVSLAGLDLSTADGARAARQRLREVARRLCDHVADNFDLSHQSNFVACVDETLATALRRSVEIAPSTAFNEPAL